jgi:hypothetical protein
MKIVKRILEKLEHVALNVLERVPIARPFRPYIQVGSQRAGGLVAQAVTSNAGQADLSSAMVRTGIIVALTALVVGVIIWRAIVTLGNDVAGDIEAAGNWGG